tara:strand:+ start:703 stop:942 length:240 start_codon:yes stop_codon:yes gene_type:complete
MAKKLIIDIAKGTEEYVELTAEEENVRQQDFEKQQIEDTAIKEKETKKLADQKTGNQKLLDLGLTQDEATALTGYAPND